MILKEKIYRVYLWLLMKRKFRMRFQKPAPGNKPMLYYGKDDIPGRGELACGGMIKVQDLQHIFPNTLKDANILYLVSSKLPPYPAEMARYAKSKGFKLVVNQNGTAYPAWHGPGWEKTNRPIHQVLEQADYVFYQSAFCKQAADLHLVSQTGSFEILHNPVDTGVFVPASSKPGGYNLISFGTLNQFYRAKCAVDTVDILRRSLPEIHLTFAGQYHWHPDHNKAKEDLIKLVQDKNLEKHIIIQESYSQKEIVSLLQQHHIALHTKYNDPCPRLVVEAMSCGLPVVYSSSGGVPELVGNEGGIGIRAPIDWDKIHEPSPKKLAEAVLTIFENLEKYSVAARSRAVKKLDVHHWISRHDIVFRELLK